MDTTVRYIFLFGKLSCKFNGSKANMDIMDCFSYESPISKAVFCGAKQFVNKQKLIIRIKTELALPNFKFSWDF